MTRKTVFRIANILFTLVVTGAVIYFFVNIITHKDLPTPEIPNPKTGGERILEIFKQFNEEKLFYFLGFLILGALVNYFSFFSRSLLWRSAIEPLKVIKISLSYRAVMMGMFLNTFFPFRLGDIARTTYVAYHEKLSKASLLSTLFVEKVFDIFSIVILILVTLPFIPWRRINQIAESFLVSTHISMDLIFFIVGAFIGGILLITVLSLILIILESRGNPLITNLIKKIFPEKAADLFISLVHKVLEGLKSIKSIRLFFKFMFYSLLIWVTQYLIKLVVLIPYGLWSFHLDFQEMLTISLILLILVNLIMLIPALPGSVGFFEFGILIGFALYNLSDDKALSYGLILHIVYWFSFISCGLYFILKHKISLSSLISQSRKDQQDLL